MWAILTDPAKTAGRWQPEEFFATGVADIDHLAQQAQELGFRLQGTRALDFGCGIGRLTFALGKYYDQCVGVDIAPSMIRLAGKFNLEPSKYEFILNRSASLEIFPSESFDLIYSTLVLQHMAPGMAKKYIAEFLRLVRPGGHIAFQMPTQLIRRTQARRDVRSILRDYLPMPVLKLYRMLRNGSSVQPIPKVPVLNSPQMEMHGVPIKEMRAWITACSGKIQNVQESRDDRIGWQYAFYWISKVR